MSDRDKMVIGSRRRLLSSDFNDGERLVDRALLELVSAQQLGDAYKAIAAGVGGVLAGLEVRAVAGTNEVEVQPGIALVAEAPTSSLLDPPVNIIELRVATRVPLGGFVDGANPRLVTIEIEATQVSKLNKQVDVFDPQTGAFGTAAQDIVTGSTPTLSVRAGTAGPSPQVAAGPSADGWIPLAVVKLATSQASFSDPYVPVLLCRPMLSALGGTLIAESTVQGGGISVGEEAGGVIATASSCVIHDARVDLRGLPARLLGFVGFAGTVYARTPNTTSPAALLASTGAVYCYAVPPPWVNDYGTIAPREARVLNPNQVDLASTPDSVVFGEGPTFTSLGVGNVADKGPTFTNGFAIWDDQPPAGIELGLVSNAPRRVTDMRGPSTGSLTLDQTQDPSWGNSQIVTDSVYLGSVSAIGGAGFVGQSYRGGGQIRLIDLVANRPDFSVVISTGVLDPLYPGRFPGMQVGDTDILPSSSGRVEVSTALSNTGAAGTAELTLKSAFGFGALAANPNLGGVERTRYAGADLPGASNFGTHVVELERDLTGQAFVTVLVGGGGTGQVTLEGYEDVLIASR